MEVGPNAPTVTFTLEAVPYFRDSFLRLVDAHQPLCYCQYLLKSVTEEPMNPMQDFTTDAA